MAERVSLTKAQRESGIGAELLALCQSVTEDGVLTAEEIKEIMRWLRDNRDAELPAKDFLFETIKGIVADGKVTKDEQKELYRAIEVILPPDARKIALQQRKEFEAEQKHREKIAKEQEREEEQAERERSRPQVAADFMVAGVHYEGRPQIITTHVSDGLRVFLVRDQGNRFSPHATVIRLINGLEIGFVPEIDAVEVAPYPDQGLPQWACIKKILTGGRVPIPVVLAYIYRADCGVEGVVLSHQIPPKATQNAWWPFS